MAKIKKRSKAPFVGRRKNQNMARKMKPVVEEPVVVDEEVGHQAEPEMENNEEPQVSASAKKMKFFGIDLNIEVEKVTDQTNNENNDCYLIVQKSSLIELFAKTACPDCGTQGMCFKMDAGKFSGFASKGSLTCTVCHQKLADEYLCKRLGNSTSARSPFEINILSTLAFRSIGCGYSAMEDWCASMNIPHCMNKSAYQKNHSKIEEASKETFNEISQESVKAIASEYAKLGIEPDENGVLDIGVSYDGSWQKRGHSSHNGMASVIDIITGLPIDYEVLSNFCLKCKVAENENPADAWKEKHAVNCPKNFQGTSNAMEVECAKRLWGRSIERHKLRYTAMLSDGDSKSFDAVSTAEVYGKEKKIVKEDCINHVSKRMGTALKKLVDSSKAQGSTISGKGKLTQEKILKIQNYYGRAIKDNAHDIELAKKRIFAILFHMTSSDAHPKHMHCPPGPTSWCFWQRNVANGKEEGSHKEHETLPADIGKRLVPIFIRLSDGNLLKRCIHAKTQNANESFHNVIWKIAPKAIFVGRKTIETAVSLAACQFAMGANFRTVLCKALGIEPGAFLKAVSTKKNIKRLQNANKKATAEAKQRRKKMKYKNLAKESEKKRTEGPTYAAGNF